MGVIHHMIVVPRALTMNLSGLQNRVPSHVRAVVLIHLTSQILGEIWQSEERACA